MLVAPAIASAQDIILTGSVKSNAQAPIPNAFISVPQLSLTQVANASGEYRFVIPAARAGTQVTVEARSIGHQNTSVPVTLRAGTITQNIVMAVKAVQLDEIVVSGTAGRQERRAQAAAVASIDASQIIEAAPITSVASLLQARTPGLVVRNNSGTTGTYSDIRIRGISSISLSNEPLVYVDGIRVTAGREQLFGVGNQGGSRLNDIKMEDIEKVDVVKGPAAATMYGSDAVAGVINIITKRGRAGSGFVQTISGENGSVNANFTPMSNYGRCTASTQTATGLLSFPNCAGRKVDTVITDSPLERDKSFGDGNYRNINYSLQGGGEKFGAFFSLGSDGDHGIVPNSFYGHNSARTNFDYAVRDNLHMSFGMGIVNTKTQLPRNDNDIYGYLGGGMLGDPRTVCGATCPVGGTRKDGWYAQRQSSELSTYENIDRTTRYQPTGSVRFSPFSWMDHKLTVGADMAREEAVSFWAKNDSSWWDDAPRNTGQVSQARQATDRYTIDYLGNARRNLTQDLRLDLSGGMQALARRFDYVDASGQGLVNNDVRTVNSAATLLSGSQTNSDNRDIGVLGQVELSYRERLYFKLGTRRDQSSSFGADSKPFYSPNIGLSYVISDEDYFRRMTSFLPEFAITQLRLRTAYGISGRQPTSGARSTFSASTNLLPTGALVVGVRPGAIGNPEIRAEKGQEFEAGADMGFLRDKLSLEATYFHKKGIDQILTLPTPGSVGSTNGPQVNIGSLLNKGWELASEARLITRENVAFSLRGTMATLHNELLDLGSVPPSATRKVGFPLNGVWDYEIDSLNITGNNPANWRAYISDSLKFKGNGANYPGWDAALSGTMTLFKDLSLYAQIDGRGDMIQFDGTNEFRDRQFGQGAAAVIGAAAFGGDSITGGAAWETAKEEYVRRFGTFVTASGVTVNRGSVRGAYNQSGKFWKLREASATYNLPKDFVRRYTRAKSVLVGLTARNINTWTDFTGLDPESDQFLTVPSDKRYTMRFSLTF
jgi:TonB-dependent starch-binding outer membrane protein SusC